MLKYKLKNVRDNWKNAHYCGSENEEKMLQRLVQILEEIDALADNFEMGYKEQDKKEKALYEEFGELLFKPRDYPKYNCENEVETTVNTNGIQMLWD